MQVMEIILFIDSLVNDSFLQSGGTKFFNDMRSSTYYIVCQVQASVVISKTQVLKVKATCLPKSGVQGDFVSEQRLLAIWRDCLSKVRHMEKLLKLCLQMLIFTSVHLFGIQQMLARKEMSNYSLFTHLLVTLVLVLPKETEGQHVSQWDTKYI